MTINEKLDLIMNNTSTTNELTFNTMATSNYTVPESLRDKYGMVVFVCYSSSSSSPASMSVNTTGLSVIGSATIYSGSYCKCTIYFGEFNPGQSLSVSNGSTKGAAYIGVFSI